MPPSNWSNCVLALPLEVLSKDLSKAVQEYTVKLLSHQSPTRHNHYTDWRVTVKFKFSRSQNLEIKQWQNINFCCTFKTVYCNPFTYTSKFDTHNRKGICHLMPLQHLPVASSGTCHCYPGWHNFPLSWEKGDILVSWTNTISIGQWGQHKSYRTLSKLERNPQIYTRDPRTCILSRHGAQFGGLRVFLVIKITAVQQMRMSLYLLWSER